MANAAPENSSSIASERSLPALFGVIAVDLIGFGVVIPILPYYAKHLDASPLVLGLLLAVYPALQFAFSPVWGRVSDRVGRKPVMLATLAGSAAALALLGLADSLAGLFAGRILGGVFGANISVATAYVADVTRESERTRWMGMVGACFGVGFVLGPAIGGLLAPNLDGSWPAAALVGEAVAARIAPFGYGIPMLFAAALAAVNCAFAAFVLVEPARHANLERGVGRIAVLRDPRVRRLCALNLIFSLAVTQLESIFAYFMIDRFQYDAMRVAFILVGMALLMGAIQGGAIRALAARFGERALALAGFALMAAALLALPFMPTVGWTLVPLALAAVGRGIGQPPVLSLVSICAAPEQRGVVMGTFQSSASLARVFGPAAAGALYTLYPAGPFVLSAGLMSIAWRIALGLPASRESRSG
ncbi:MAG TPA: MFS transporter [Myxococcota bacterium]|nr:MFS transporter [Myxococcota bacterium]